MRPIDSHKLREGLFEVMMGMTVADWEALGSEETEDDVQSASRDRRRPGMRAMG